eukprot:6193119-Pleurochrysis_carterae.AAC.1
MGLFSIQRSSLNQSHADHRFQGRLFHLPCRHAKGSVDSGGPAPFSMAYSPRRSLHTATAGLAGSAVATWLSCTKNQDGMRFTKPSHAAYQAQVAFLFYLRLFPACSPFDPLFFSLFKNANIGVPPLFLALRKSNATASAAVRMPWLAVAIVRISAAGFHTILHSCGAFSFVCLPHPPRNASHALSVSLISSKVKRIEHDIALA